MEYLINQDNFNQLIQIDSFLAQIEVRGDSVQYLMSSRLSLKRIVDSLEKIEEKENINKQIKEE